MTMNTTRKGYTLRSQLSWAHYRYTVSELSPDCSFDQADQEQPLKMDN